MSGRVIWSCSEKKTHKNPEVSRPMAEDTAILDFRDLHMLCILKNLVICFYKKEPATLKQCLATRKSKYLIWRKKPDYLWWFLKNLNAWKSVTNNFLSQENHFLEKY